MSPFCPRRGVIWQVPILTSAQFIARASLLGSSPLGGGIQITARCALTERIGLLTTGCCGARCSVVNAVVEIVLVAVNDNLRGRLLQLIPQADSYRVGGLCAAEISCNDSCFF